ncbi:MAG: hypothetical protein LBW85_04295 [Deltaproteobacteria bacterium]|jgi:hypothetical protein|nr:hypothetical protein [Deltaproteobacteria bacterium]
MTRKLDGRALAAASFAALLTAALLLPGGSWAAPAAAAGGEGSLRSDGALAGVPGFQGENQGRDSNTVPEFRAPWDGGGSGSQGYRGESDPRGDSGSRRDYGSGRDSDQRGDSDPRRGYSENPRDAFKNRPEGGPDNPGYPGPDGGDEGLRDGARPRSREPRRNPGEAFPGPGFRLPEGAEASPSPRLPENRSGEDLFPGRDGRNYDDSGERGEQNDPSRQQPGRPARGFWA